jgi:hypothetical protein
VAGLFEAEIKPFAAILRFRCALYALDVLFSALGAAHHTVRPTHLLDVLQALFVSGELLVCFSNVHEQILAQISICVK